MPIGIADGQLGAPSGARQEPLTSAAQIVPGAIITGPAWALVRQVRDAFDGGGWILDIYPRGATPHTCAFAVRGEGRECAVCHAFIAQVAQLLPVTEGGIARSYLVVPDGPSEEVDPWTVYVTASGHAIVAARNEASGLVWTASHVPILPRLAIGWRLPSALRALVEGQ